MRHNAVQEQSSEAQVRPASGNGKISNETLEEWNRETGAEKLPERVGHRTTRKKKAVKKRTKRKTKKSRS
jgi:hypothetical protein